MYKLIIRLLLAFVFGLYVFLLYIIPIKLYKLNLNIFEEIFPAVEIAIIYFFSSYYKVQYWLLFIIGIILDQSNQLPMGVNASAFIIANIILVYINKCLILKDYITNLVIFCIYSFFIISFRCLILLKKSEYSFDGLSVYFYYLTTILSYPAIRFLICKPLNSDRITTLY